MRITDPLLAITDLKFINTKSDLEKYFNKTSRKLVNYCITSIKDVRFLFIKKNRLDENS